MGGASLDNQQYFDEDVKLMFDLFPRLKERINQRGGTLSGAANSRCWPLRAR